MIDINYFKGFNDRCGHMAGDKCLFNVDTPLNSGPHYSKVRIGSEEFSVLLPATIQEECRNIGQCMVGAVTTLATDNEAIPRGKSVAEQ